MRHALFHSQLHSHHEAVWVGLLGLSLFLVVVLLIVLATLHGWQLPTPPPAWTTDFINPVPTPIGPH